MARLIHPLKRTRLLYHHKSLIPQQSPIFFHHKVVLEQTNPNLFCICQAQKTSTRNYMSEMRKTALKDSILRLIRNEIQYELDRSPPKQPVTKFEAFAIDDCPGEQWIRLKRKFKQNEEIKVEATMFDGAIPIPNSGTPGVKEDTQLHITSIVTISKGDGDVLEIMCSVWPDSIEITNLFIRRSKKMPAQAYMGPEFKELDDELQDSLCEFLEARGVDDEMAVFLHEYMKNKGKTEYIRWLGTLKSIIEIIADVILGQVRNIYQALEERIFESE